MSWATTIPVRLVVLVASAVVIMGVAATSTTPAVTSSPPKTHTAVYLSGGWGGRFVTQ